MKGHANILRLFSCFGLGVSRLAKQKIAFVCKECGADHIKWQGQCDACNAWNSLVEVKLGASGSRAPAKRVGFSGASAEVQKLSAVSLDEHQRTPTGYAEFDRVLGGGLVGGSALVIGGHPGAGKSTLLLQVLSRLSQAQTALYVTGEESPQQVAMRARRLELPTDKLDILAETSVVDIVSVAQQLKPKILVIDSIQVMHIDGVDSAPGSVTQVRECAAELVRFAKQTGTVLFLVGHVTKEGNLAGPKVLEHMIDCLMMLEGDGDSRYRVLRGTKNRFGAVNELGIFAMTETGLREVSNPSAIFLNRAEEVTPGSVVIVNWEGTRPLLVELQALVDSTSFSNPRRVVVGLDHNRLAMLLAVLHRHGGIVASDQDVFVNVVGGVKVAETSADLPLLLAIVSSLRERTLPADLIAFGEVGLSGEIRPVPNGQERIREAAKHGFKRAIVPVGNKPKKPISGMKVMGVANIRDALQEI